MFCFRLIEMYFNARIFGQLRQEICRTKVSFTTLRAYG
jgi:hypothetical protein